MFDCQMIHVIAAGSRRSGRIERDTPLVARSVAEAVLEEASVWLGEPLPQQWIAELTARAQAVDGGRRPFHRLLRRPANTGRDWLWAFTRHWLAALIWRHRRDLHARLPDSYNVGHGLPRRQTTLAVGRS